MFPMTVSFTLKSQEEFDALMGRNTVTTGPDKPAEVTKPAGKPKAEKPAATSSAPAADAASPAQPKADASAPKVEAAGEPAPAPAAKALDYMKDVAPKVAEAQTKDRAATIALLEKLGARGADGKLKGSNVPADKLAELVEGLANIITPETVE
jgi:hypothetical protein